MSTRKKIRRNAAKKEGLSVNEMDVLLWLSKGKRYSEIAGLMRLSYGAVKMIGNRTQVKMGAATIGGMVGSAFRRQMIT